MILIDRFVEAKKALLAYFMCEQGDYKIEDLTSTTWSRNGHDINFSYPDTPDDIYGLDVRFETMYTSPAHTMFLVDDGNGSDDFLVIFSNDLEVPVE